MYIHRGAELWTVRLSGQMCLVLNTWLFKVMSIYMFMNKTISYFYTCPKKLPNVLHQPVATERIRVIVQHNTNFTTVHSRVNSSDSRRLLNDVQAQTWTSVCSCYCSQNAVYQCFVYLHDIATGPHEEFLNKIFPLCRSLFSKLLDTHLWVSSSISAATTLFYSEI